MDQTGTNEIGSFTKRDGRVWKSRPQDGITADQPFARGTGGSNCFRIPSLVTLQDGALLAAADARWNHTGDGFCPDTMVSRSKDSGRTWNYTFANYLGDNGNEYHPKSTAFLDPALAVKGDKVYLLTDLYPGGIYIGNAEKGTGYDENGHLLLKRRGDLSYEYYMGDIEEGTAGIYRRDGSRLPDFQVDAHFNWYYCGAAGGNLFFHDDLWQVVPTGYLYLTRSEDGGKTWSAPVILNAQVKKDTESFYGVGPGRGLVTEGGRILFPCYTYDGTKGQRSSFIYSDDEGRSWKRSVHITDDLYSGENQLTELWDGRIRCFFRSGRSRVCYADAWWDGRTYYWDKYKETEIPCCPDCQLSVITYSKKLKGRQALLISCPSDPRERMNGRVTVALIREDGELQPVAVHEITGRGVPFAYSCLTELQDGTAAVLYEGGEHPITFERIHPVVPDFQLNGSKTESKGSDI